MWSLVVLSVASLASVVSARVGDTATGQIDVLFPNKTRAGCVDKYLRWVTDENACDRFHVRMGVYDGDEGEQSYQLQNSKGWGCSQVMSTEFFCKEGRKGNGWIKYGRAVPKDGDWFSWNAYGLGTPGSCELSPLYGRKKVHRLDIQVRLRWANVQRTNKRDTAPNRALLTPVAKLAKATPTKCRTTKTLTSASATHTFATDKPWSGHHPGHMDVVHDGKVTGCLDLHGKWTVNRANCGTFKGGVETGPGKMYIDLVNVEKGWSCEAKQGNKQYLVCQWGTDNYLTKKDLNLVHGKDMDKIWHAASVPTGDEREEITEDEGDVGIEVKWAFMDASGN